jgi:hypothetical protein
MHNNTPEQNRALVANASTARNRPVGACPLAVRLHKAGRTADLQRLADFGKVIFPDVWHQARGNLPETKGEMMLDRLHETRPSPDELMSIAARDAIAMRAAIGPITRLEHENAMRRTTRRDSRGRITEWQGSDNRWRPVVELRRQAKGMRREAETERREAAELHIRTFATGSFPIVDRGADYYSEGVSFWRIRHASMCHAMLAANDNRRIETVRLGIDGHVPFDKARANVGLSPSVRCATAIAKGAEFIGGCAGSNSGAHKAPVDGGNFAVEDAIIGAIDQPRIDAALGNRNAEFLNLSLAGKTAKQIAVILRLGNGKAGERRVVSMQDSALVALADIEQRLAA